MQGRGKTGFGSTYPHIERTELKLKNNILTER